MEYGQETLDLVASIMEDGVEHVAIFMRHSARTYIPGLPDFENELTDDGRELACQLGAALPKEATVRGYSSPVNRCVETANLILGGHSDGGGEITRRRQIEGLGNAHILDFNKLARLVEEVGMDGLYGRWFDDLVPRDMLLPSKALATITAHIVKDKLQRPLGGPQLDILVSHDMNIYPMRHHLLGQTIEDHGSVEYPDAIAFFERDGEVFLQSHHGDAQSLALEE